MTTPTAPVGAGALHGPHDSPEVSRRGSLSCSSLLGGAACRGGSVSALPGFLATGFGTRASLLLAVAAATSSDHGFWTIGTAFDDDECVEDEEVVVVEEEIEECRSVVDKRREL